ncbi:MAG: hypothetical protein IJM30_02300 [Thermoguttaceae bacterium]|nr:hypothetical protein [Thermoguttaceae bacterium]
MKRSLTKQGQDRARRTRKTRFETLETRDLLSATEIAVDAFVDDPGDGLTSLREAIEMAPREAIIRFELPDDSECELTEDLVVDKSLFFDASDVEGLTIVGNGVAGLRISGDFVECAFANVRFYQCATAVEITDAKYVEFYDCAFVECDGGIDAANAAISVENCSFVSCSVEGSGGAIRAVGSLASIVNSTFVDCRATTSGGAIAVCDDDSDDEDVFPSDVSISDCLFQNDRAPYGGAIDVAGVSDGDETQTILALDGANRFVENLAEQGGAIRLRDAIVSSDDDFARSAFERNGSLDDAILNYGGAVYVGANGRFSCERAVFRENESTGGGGAFYVDPQGELVLTDSTVSGNKSTKYGGAIYNGGSVEIFGGEISENEGALGGAYYGFGALRIERDNLGDSTIFQANIATSVDGKYGSGGAIYGSTKNGAPGTVSVDGGVFRSNEAAKYGGAVANYGDLFLKNSTFIECVGASGGALQAAGTTTLENCSFQGNKARFAEFELSPWDYGGNGGAIFASNNASSPAPCSIEFRGELLFVENAADNAGGAINPVSGAVRFRDVDARFCANEAGAAGGAVFLVGGDLDFGERSTSAFLFEDNVSNRFAPTVGALAATDPELAARLSEGFGLEPIPERFDNFSRSVVLSEPVVSFALLRDLAGVSARSIFYRLSENDEYRRLTSGETISFEGTDPAELRYRVDNVASVELRLSIVVRPTDAIEVRAIEIGKDRDVWALSFASRAKEPIARWEIAWSDGTRSSGEGLTYSWSAFRFAPAEGELRADLKVTYADGFVFDYGIVASKLFQSSDENPGEGEDDPNVFEPEFLDELEVL